MQMQPRETRYDGARVDALVAQADGIDPDLLRRIVVHTFGLAVKQEPLLHHDGPATVAIKTARDGGLIAQIVAVEGYTLLSGMPLLAFSRRDAGDAYEIDAAAWDGNPPRCEPAPVAAAGAPLRHSAGEVAGGSDDDDPLADLHAAAYGIPLMTLRAALSAALAWQPVGDRRFYADDRLVLMRVQDRIVVELGPIPGLRLASGEARFGFVPADGRATELAWRGEAPVWTAFTEPEFDTLARAAGVLPRQQLRALLDEAVTRVPEEDETVTIAGRVAMVTRAGRDVFVDVLVRDAERHVADIARVRFRLPSHGGVADPAWEAEPIS